MAYTFNAINSALDGNEKLDMFSEQKPQKANPQFAGRTSNGSVQLASSSGGGSFSPASQPGSPAPASAPASRPSPSYNPGFAQKAVRGIGSIDSSAQRTRIASDTANANDKLQAEANAYADKVKSTAAGYTLDSGTLEKAAQGDDAALKAAQARLAKTQNDPFESFKGLKDEELPSSADNLRKKENFGEIYRPTASANFGTGESRWQSLLLAMDPSFRAQSRTLVGAQDKLVSDNDKAVIDRTKEASETLSKAYTEATGKARADLTRMSDDVMSAAESRAVQEAAVRAGLDPRTISKAELAKLADSIRKDFQGTGGLTERALAYLDNPDAFDLSKYVTIDKDVSAADVLTKEEVDRFNRINGLLGNGKLATVSATGAGPQYTFDQAGAAQDLRTQLEGRRQAEDRDLQMKIDQIQLAAGQRGAKELGDPIQNAKDYITRRYLEQNEGQSAEQLRAEKEAFNQLFREGTNWVPYFTEKGAINTNKTPRTWAEMLTPQEAAELNELSKAAGLGDTYQAGTLYNQSNYDPTYFSGQFEKAFERILGELNGTRPLHEGEGMGRVGIVNPLVDGRTNTRSPNVLDEMLHRNT